MNFTTKYCDYLNLFKELPDDSIPLIVTDPPYGKRYRELYKGLARESKRVLTSNGSLIVMMGEYNQLQMLNDMNNYLNFQRNITYYMKGSKAVILEKRIRNKKKELAWFCKSNNPMHKGLVDDLIISETKCKKHHVWGQPVEPFKAILNMFPYKGSIVLDPFMGGGAVGIAALEMSHCFIGCDSNLKAFKETSKRLNNYVTKNKESFIWKDYQTQSVNQVY